MNTVTKEEVLSKVTYLDIEDVKFKHEIEIIRPSECYEAMDIWAKEECIKFYDFVTTNYPNIHPLNRTLSPARLYFLYLQNEKDEKI